MERAGREVAGTPVEQATILVVEDDPALREVLEEHLTGLGYRVVTAASAEAALGCLDGTTPDLILTDVHMGPMSGVELCRRLKSDLRFQLTPVILLTAAADLDSRVAGLAAGADDFFAKPFDFVELRTRVAVLLRVKSLHDKVQAQAAELAEWTRTLEERVRRQVEELERVGRLRRYLPPQVVGLIVSAGDAKVLESHRQEITVVSCDLRGFTAFSETAEPEEVMRVLQEYHGAVGPLISSFEGTLEHFAGDGLMIFFNDPLPCQDPAARAVRMAVAMRHAVGEVTKIWRERGCQLGFGVGIGLGYATLGQIGFEGRAHYGAIGTVPNLASRLCAEAQSGQILVSQRVYSAVKELVEAAPVGELTLKGFLKSVPAYNVIGLKESSS